MGIELWFKSDLSAYLDAFERTVRNAAPEFRAGYLAALDDMRTALSIPLPQRGEVEGQARLLEE